MITNYGRIISGKYKGKKIPFSNNPLIRPTTDRVKETIFNILQHSYIDNLKGVVLDLFAGCGSLGIECLSRGAIEVIFVDKNKQAIKDIKNFVNTLNLNNNSTYIVSDSTTLNLLNINKKISLVFLDPPYESNLIEDSLNFLVPQKVFNDNCIFVAESSKNINIKNLTLKQSKNIGKTIIKIYSLK